MGQKGFLRNTVKEQDEEMDYPENLILCQEVPECNFTSLASTVLWLF